MEEDIKKQCFNEAKKVIRECSTSNGLYASAGKNGYNALWSRDSMISMIGASIIDEPGFKETFRKSIEVLAKYQGRTGQIPNAVDIWEERESHVDFQSIDSTLWFLIGIHIYRNRYNDNSLLKKYKVNIDKALNWLRCQDLAENNMLVQLPTTDWFDAFPHRYGYTINTQALYYKVLKLMWETDDSINLKKTVNEDSDKRLWDKEFYSSYRWKNHNKYQERSDWFDSLGNLLAICFDLATEKKAKAILNYIEKKKIAIPYPIKTIIPSLTKKHKDWHDYYLDCDSGTPDSYSNGGIWGFIGGFYILALIKYRRMKDAEKMLELLAERNLSGNFPEWTHPKTKKHHGKLQAWEAGMYILAYESFQRNKVLL